MYDIMWYDIDIMWYDIMWYYVYYSKNSMVMDIKKC